MKSPKTACVLSLSGWARRPAALEMFVSGEWRVHVMAMDNIMMGPPENRIAHRAAHNFSFCPRCAFVCPLCNCAKSVLWALAVGLDATKGCPRKP